MNRVSYLPLTIEILGLLHVQGFLPPLDYQILGFHDLYKKFFQSGSHVDDGTNSVWHAPSHCPVPPG